MNIIDIVPEQYTTRPQFKKLEGSLLSSPCNYIISLKEKELQFHSKECLTFHHTSKEDFKALTDKLNINANNILDLALQINEDVVILNRSRLESLCVCFPSGWYPGKQYNKTLEDIHRPVADNEALMKASSRLADIMCSGSGPWYRTVWTLTTNPNLSNYPTYKSFPPKSLDDLYFRYEIQTFDTVIKDQMAVFFIQTIVKPLSFVADTEEKMNRIKTSINSMSDNILQYKNLVDIKTLLCNDTVALS